MGQLTSALKDVKLTGIKHFIIFKLREYQKREHSGQQKEPPTVIRNLEFLLGKITHKLLKQKYPVPDGLSPENFAQMLLLKTLCEEVRETGEEENGYFLEIETPKKTMTRNTLYVSRNSSGGLNYKYIRPNTNQIMRGEFSKTTLQSFGIVLPQIKTGEPTLNADRVLLRKVTPHFSSLLKLIRKTHLLNYCPDYDAMLTRLITSYHQFFSATREPVFTDPTDFEEFVESLLPPQSDVLSAQKSQLILAFAGHSITGGSDIVKYLNLTHSILYTNEGNRLHWHNIIFGADLVSQTSCVDLYRYLKAKIGQFSANNILFFTIQQIRQTISLGEHEYEQLIKEKKDASDTIQKLNYCQTQLAQLLFMRNEKSMNESDKRVTAIFAVEKIKACTTMQEFIDAYYYYRNHLVITARRNPTLDTMASLFIFFGQPFYTDAEISILIASQKKLHELSKAPENKSPELAPQAKELYKALFSEETIQKMRGREFDPADKHFPPQEWVSAKSAKILV